MRRAFSLVELLVVIAIIAIIAAILFPVMASVKRAAKEKTDQSQLRQVAVAFHLYRIDNDDRGYQYMTGPGYPTRYPWNSFEGLSGYLTSGSMVWCPFGHGGEKVPFDVYAIQTWVEPIGDAQLHHAYKPESGRVVAYCGNHTNGVSDPRFESAGTLRVGKYLFAREDTSAGVAENSKMGFQWCGGDGCTDIPTPGLTATLRFPGEPWPPTKE